MGAKSNISWCGATWNPWQGCRKKSPACKFCYMFADKSRYGQDPLDIHVSARATFEAPLKWQREVERGDREGSDRLVFTCFWSDWYIREADAWRSDAWAIVKECPDLIFQVLTKRSERIADHTPWVSGGDTPWPNVWLGVSVENQQYADERIPQLMRVPAALWFLSVEPLLGHVDLNRVRWQLPDSIGVVVGSVLGDSDGRSFSPRGAAGKGIGWVIVGGESGSGARPMDPQWARSVRDQCQTAGVPFFFKQWGEWAPYRMPGVKEDFSHPALGGEAMYRVGKKAAGHVLDGRVWEELPQLALASLAS